MVALMPGRQFFPCLQPASKATFKNINFGGQDADATPPARQFFPCLQPAKQLSKILDNFSPCLQLSVDCLTVRLSGKRLTVWKTADCLENFFPVYNQPAKQLSKILDNFSPCLQLSGDCLTVRLPGDCLENFFFWFVNEAA